MMFLCVSHRTSQGDCVDFPAGDTGRKVDQTSPVPTPTIQLATTTPTPTSTTTDPFTTTPKPTTTPTTTRTTTAAAAVKSRPGLQHRVRDTGQQHGCLHCFPLTNTSARIKGTKQAVERTIIQQIMNSAVQCRHAEWIRKLIPADGLESELMGWSQSCTAFETHTKSVCLT